MLIPERSPPYRLGAPASRAGHMRKDDLSRPREDVPEIRPVSEPCWQLLLQLAQRRRTGALTTQAAGYFLDADHALQQCAPDADSAALICGRDGSFAAGPALTADEQAFVSLYCPLLSATAMNPVTVGHLGQSLDSRIATAKGDSFYVTGTQNLQHLHRMRALCDAIVVGANTALADNPRLTTRLVEGPNPVRVVLDPSARLDCPLHLLDDDAAPTLLVHARGVAPRHEAPGIIHIDGQSGELNPQAVRAALVARGLHAIFVEGGGVTVSHWLNARALSRLQLACAPMLVGNGRPAIQIPGSSSMSTAMRPTYRLYQMGEDLLYDFDLLAPGAGDDGAPSTVFRRLV